MSLQLYKGAKMEKLRWKGTHADVPTDDGLASIDYAGQLRLRHGKPRLNYTEKSSFLGNKGSFNSEHPENLVRCSPKPLNFACPAVRLLEYWNKKKRSNVVQMAVDNSYYLFGK